MTTGVINNWDTLNVTGVITPTAIETPSLTATSLSATVVAATYTVVASAAPTAADDPGVTGTITWDADFIYVCVDTDTWVRAALATWP